MVTIKQVNAVIVNYIIAKNVINRLLLEVKLVYVGLVQ
jgi:hypothetical protein